MALEVVLAATDFSPQAELAVTEAANIAGRCGARLVLLHVNAVAEPAPTGVIFSARALTQVDSLVEEQRRLAAARLERQAEKLRGSDLEVTVRLAVSRPGEGIVATAEEVGAGLIVTGTHGRTGFARFLLGSVASRVVRLSSLPVLVVRDEVAGAGGFKHILVPTDFSPASEASLALAAALAHDEAVIELFHLWQLPGLTNASLEAARKALGSVASEIDAAYAATAGEWIARHRRARQTLRFTQDAGTPAPVIHDRLVGDEGPYDLVALGAHGARGFRRLLIGRVAESIVRHAPCSALVTRAPADD